MAHGHHHHHYNNNHNHGSNVNYPSARRYAAFETGGLSPITVPDSPHSASSDQSAALEQARLSSFFVVQNDQCPEGTKIGKLWKRHRGNRIYETFFFKTVNEHLYYYKWKFEAENQEQPRGAYSLVNARVVRKGKNIFLHVAGSKEPKRMFCMEERKAREWEEHLKKRIAWSTPLPGAKRQLAADIYSSNGKHNNSPFGLHSSFNTAAPGEKNSSRNSGRSRRKNLDKGRNHRRAAGKDRRDSHHSSSHKPQQQRLQQRMQQRANRPKSPPTVAQNITLPIEMKYSYSQLEATMLLISKLSIFEKTAAAICLFLLIAYYVYAPMVLAVHFDTSKLMTVLGVLLFLAILSSLVQIVFKTSIVEEFEDAGYI